MFDRLFQSQSTESIASVSPSSSVCFKSCTNCLGLCKRLYLESSLRNPICSAGRSFQRGGFCGGRSLFLLKASQQNQHQAKRRSPQPRLGLAFVSKAAQLFGLEQAAVSGVISARSDMQCRAIILRRWVL
jgi:hypothetical protein